MWQLVDRTRYASERCFTRGLSGAETWIVAVKGTFVIRDDGTTEVAEVQEPVTTAPSYTGEAGRSSLRADPDLVLEKRGTDVLVHGRAYAPKGKPATRVDVGLRCGPIAKMLAVFGDRTWRRDAFSIVPSAPAPFLEMPISWERAFGGVDPSAPEAREARNPVGTGFARSPTDLVGGPVPNVEIGDALITSARDRPAPAGLGPIARDWAPRLGLAGTYDAAWMHDRMPLLPLDFDARFFSAAPVDQQVPGYLREGALVELLHLTPEGLLRFHLPRVRPCFRTILGREIIEHRPRLHTVILLPDARRVQLVWHTALPCQGKEHRLERTVIREKAYV